MSLEERVRERLADIISDHHDSMDGLMMCHDAADQILREFRLQPVAQGKVGEGGVVTPL